MKLKAVFLDKDGHLMPETSQIPDPAKTDLNEELIEGLQLLQSNGYLLVVVSNKSEIGSGKVNEENNTIKSMCSKMGIYLDGFYYSPNGFHGNETLVEKAHAPNPGMILKAAGDMDIDLSSSWMIGDVINDMEAGNRAGCKTVFVNNGKEGQWDQHTDQAPRYQAKNIAEAARRIVNP